MGGPGGWGVRKSYNVKIPTKDYFDRNMVLNDFMSTLEAVVAYCLFCLGHCSFSSNDLVLCTNAVLMIYHEILVRKSDKDDIETN